jgi:biotin transport system substrate-specific component
MTTALIGKISPRAAAREVGIAVGLAGLTALASKVAFHLPWTPVPATMQTAAVIFAGAAFGARRGLASQLAYLALGLMGAPVFASWTLAGPAALLSPSGGYLLAFPLAAWLAGRWTSRWGRWGGALSGLGVIYVLGSAWLAGFALAGRVEEPLVWTLWAGVLPFLPFGLLKAGLAVITAAPLRRRSAPAAPRV